MKSLAIIKKDVDKEKGGWGVGMGLVSGIERFGLWPQVFHEHSDILEKITSFLGGPQFLHLGNGMINTCFSCRSFVK